MDAPKALQSPGDARGAGHVPLRLDALRAACAHRRIGRDIHYCETVGSTNDVARERALAGAAEGTVVVAEQQTRGRGRLGRVWVSPPYRNLYVSIVLRPPIAAAQAPQIGLLTGLAVAEAVRAWAPAAAIKWPNDVVIDGRKVAGILAEMEAVDQQVRWVIAGIGVNLNSRPDDFPPELRDKAVALCAAVGAPIDRVAFTQRLLSQFEERYDAFLRHGFAAIRPAWEALSCLTGRWVQIADASQRYEGTVMGMSEDGALRLREPTGRERAVVAGDVTVSGAYGAPSAGPTAGADG
jgi:BirA family biotin operon repressor/biotin-[acetyl-CoA-carboxylase] ligase